MEGEVDLLNTAVILTDMETDEVFDMDEVLLNVSVELPVANSLMVTDEEPLVDMEPVEEELSCVLCDMEGDPLILVEIDMVGVNVWVIVRTKLVVAVFVLKGVWVIETLDVLVTTGVFEVVDWDVPDLEEEVLRVTVRVFAIVLVIKGLFELVVELVDVLLVETLLLIVVLVEDVLDTDTDLVDVIVSIPVLLDRNEDVILLDEEAVKVLNDEPVVEGVDDGQFEI